jgi:Cof subfamily protein (haloacid dehalogenase superfamily)
LINSPYKLLVVDIDGTLVNGRRSISAEDQEAVARAFNLGLHVSLSTGRAAQACLGIINQLSLDGYHIFFDGASVSSPTQGEEVYIKLINSAVVGQMVEFAHRYEIDLELYSAAHYFAERETWSTMAHRQFFSMEPTIVDFTRLWQGERIIKGGMVTTNAGEASKAEVFCRHFVNRLRFSRVGTPAYPSVDFINILAPQVSKGKALEALASHLGVSMNVVMAVGDGANDIPLLSTAGLAVAMDNASDEVKAVADYITLDVDHSGLAAAIKKFLL